jgi:hypothetical protein
MIDILPPAEIASPLVRDLFAYWQRKAAGRIGPRPREIEPGEIKRLLPYVAIADVLNEPFDLRYRLVGTAVVDAAGSDFTGLRFSELRVTTGRDAWLAHYKRVVGQKGAFFGRYREMGIDSARFVDHGAFPLSSDGTAVDRIIEVEDWGEIRGVSRGRHAAPIWRFELLPAPNSA